MVVVMLLASCIPSMVSYASLNSPTQYDTLIVSGNGTDIAFFPSITKASNGDLITVYYWNAVHVGTDKGIIRMVKSTNNGSSWGSAVTIVDWTGQNLDVRDPHINTLANGNLVLTFFSYRYEDSVPVKGSYFSKSTDNGATWSTPVLVPSSNYWNATSGAVIELGNGDLIMPTYGPASATGNDRVTLVRSSNGGTSWGSEVVVASSTSEGFNEATFAYAGSNTIYCLMRENGKIYKSTDNGATWNFDKATGLATHAPDFLKIDNNHFFTTWCRPASYNSNRAVEGKMFQPQDGWDYTPVKLLYNSTGSGIADMGYPGNVLTADNRLLTVYYDTYRNILAGTYTTMADWEPVYVRGQKIDLLSKYNAGQVTVSTDMTWTDSAYPDVAISGAMDGSVDYWHSAYKGNANVPSYYTVTLDRTYDIKALGICLKPGYSQSADIYFSTDGINWGSAVKSYTNANQTAVDYTNFSTPAAARYVKINVTNASGHWPGLNEIELYSADTFESDTVGQVPSGYSQIGANGIVSNTQAYSGTKSLRVYDNSSSILTIISKTTTAQASKTFEAMIYPVAAPYGNIISINSGDNDNAHSVFHVGIFSDGSIQWYDGTTWSGISGAGTVGFNTWCRIRIEAGNTTSAKVYLNDVLQGTTGKWNTFSTMDRVRFMSGSTPDTGDDYYVDNVCFN